MSAIENAVANGGGAKKTFKDIYNGEAVVQEVKARDPRFTDGLTDEEKASAFDLEIKVSTPDGAEFYVQLPVSARTSKFGRETEEKTDTQRTVDELTAQKLIDGGDIATVFAKVGAKVSVNVYEETSARGSFTRCRFSRAKAALDQGEIMRRIAAMTGKKPAAPAQGAANANANATTPAPAQNANPFA